MFLAFSWQSLAFPWHFFGIFLAFSWHLLRMAVSFLTIPIYVPLFSRDSIYFKASFSCFAGTRCLCWLLLHFPIILCVSLTFPWHFRAIPLAFSWFFFDGCSSHLLSIVVSFLTIPVYVPSFSKDSIFQGFFFVFCRDWMLVLLIVAFPCNS